MSLVRQTAILAQDSIIENPSTQTRSFLEYMFNETEGTYDPWQIAWATISGSSERVYGLPAGLANLGSMAPMDSMNEWGDVMIMCGMSHIAPPNPIYPAGSPQGRDYFDFYTGVYNYDPDGFWKGCNSTKPAANEAQATMNFGMGLQSGKASLTICEWYLNASMEANFRDLSSFDTNFLTRSAAYFANIPPPGHETLAPIDEFVLFDSVLMHELLHSTFGGFKRDVDGRQSYYWANARRISTDQDYFTGAPANVDNHLNWILANELASKGLIVKEDGSF